MNVQVLDISQDDKVKKWDDFVETNGQLYHNSHWAKIIYSTYGFTPHYLYIEENGEIKSVFPLFHVKIPFLRDDLISIPHVEAGGIIHTDFFHLYFDYIYQNIRAKKIKIYQYKDPLNELTSNTDEVIMIVKLPEKKEELFLRIDRKQRRCIRMAFKKNIEVVVGNDDCILRNFYALYAQKMRELGTPPHGFTFMKKIRDVYGQSCKIILAKDSGNIMGSILLVRYQNSLFGLYWGVPKKSLKERVGTLLHYKTLEMAVENNLQCYVFGRTQKGTSLYQHKSEFGAEPVQLYRYAFVLTSEGYRAYSEKTLKQKYTLAPKIWSKLPPLITDHLGPKIRRWVY